MFQPLSEYKQRLQAHLDGLAPARRQWMARNRLFHDTLRECLRFAIAPGQRVLVLGSATGEVLADLRPSRGVGIDLSGEATRLAQAAYPDHTFVQADPEAPDTWRPQVAAGEVFDWIVLPESVGGFEDVQAALERVRVHCGPQTRLLVAHYNFLWEPVLKLAERLGLKMPQRLQNWLSPEDLANLLELADFATVKTERRLLLPKRVPLLSPVMEVLGGLPVFNRLCVLDLVVARPLPARPVAEASVSIVIPCRNERGNVEAAVTRLPPFGTRQEIIFVEGHSQDGTWEEMERVRAAYPHKAITILRQPGKGKADATWTGFEAATGEILMILDGDLTVPPEELPKFYQAMAAGHGEFINGSRLVYPMEDEAMRLLNLLGNKFFSLMFTWLLNQRIKDTLCGTKVLSRENYQRLKAGRAYFGEFDPFGDFDLLFGASKLNLHIREVPIRYRARSYGQTQISRWRHGWLLLRMCGFAMRKIKFFGHDH